MRKFIKWLALIVFDTIIKVVAFFTLSTEIVVLMVCFDLFVFYYSFSFLRLVWRKY